MQLQHRINADRANEWFRPSKTTIVDGIVRCELLPEKVYNLQDAYSSSPHTEFLNARDDATASVFIQRWGPLYETRDETQRNVIAFPIAEFYAARRYLEAYLRLIREIEKPTSEREALLEFISSVEKRDTLSNLHIQGENPAELHILTLLFRVNGPLFGWTEEASIGDVRTAIQIVVETFTPAPVSSLRVVRERRGALVRSTWSLGDLYTALRWMIWLDIDRSDPLYCCQECRKFFKSESKHQRKFCSFDTNCAGRATARKWRKADLAKKKLATEEKRRQDGTDKAR